MAKKSTTASKVIILTLLLALIASPLQAATLVWPIYRSERVCYPSRCVQLSGRVSLATGESVSGVRIYVKGANGEALSEASGTYDPTTNTWRAGIGDYRMVSYKVAISIKKNGRVWGALWTPTFYWGIW